MSQSTHHTTHGDAHSAEPTTDRHANIPLPAGAVRVHDWKRSPNDQATYRLFEGGVFPSLHDWETGEGLVAFTSSALTLSRTAACASSPGKSWSATGCD